LLVLGSEKEASMFMTSTSQAANLMDSIDQIMMNDSNIKTKSRGESTKVPKRSKRTASNASKKSSKKMIPKPFKTINTHRVDTDNF